jgi:plastocyanin
MSTTEANKTTNANAASPFPPRMSNTTGFFPPNNKAEIVKGAALLREKAYQPNPARVKAGGSITWTNLDTVVHTITSGKGITDPAMGTKFDSGMLGGSFAQRFFKPGTYPYFCQIHPTMVGTVIVK